MDTPRLDGVRKLLLKELDKDNEKYKNEKDSMIDMRDVINNGINTYIEELSDEIIELKKEKFKNELKKTKQDEELKQHMKRTKNIIYEGFIMAFVVGLAVNQFTDLIGIYKGTIPYDINVLKSSVKFVCILVLISVCTYFYKFLTDVLSYIGKHTEKEKE